MGNDKPFDYRQNRRSWVKTSLAALGSTLLPIPASSTPVRRLAWESAEARTESGGGFFTGAQHALVEELAETIIPADAHSGGAKAAKVADYIDDVLNTSVDASEKGLWQEGLRLVDGMTRHQYGRSFMDCSSEERIAVITILSEHADLTDLPEIQFFHELKRLTVRGFYTSKIGIHDELEYKGNTIQSGEYAGFLPK